MTSAVGSLCVLDASRETGQAPPLMEEGGMNEPAGQVYESYDIKRLLEMLPHRYPFLLVDRIVEARGDEYGVGIKNVTINEPQFLGHFPDNPVMPGVLVIEAMAQVAGVLVLKNIPDRHNKLVLLASVEEAKFRRPVRPGDTLRIEMMLGRRKATVAKMFGKATVNGVVVAEAQVMCKLQDRVAEEADAPVTVA